MSLFSRVIGHLLREKVRHSVTQEELRIELLLIHIERSLLRWLKHLIQMCPRCLCGEACPTGRGSGEDLGHAGGTKSFSWLGNAFGSHQRN